MEKSPHLNAVKNRRVSNCKSKFKQFLRTVIKILLQIGRLVWDKISLGLADVVKKHYLTQAKIDCKSQKI